MRDANTALSTLNARIHITAPPDWFHHCPLGVAPFYVCYVILEDHGRAARTPLWPPTKQHAPHVLRGGMAVGSGTCHYLSGGDWLGCFTSKCTVTPGTYLKLARSQPQIYCGWFICRFICCLPNTAVIASMIDRLIFYFTWIDVATRVLLNTTKRLDISREYACMIDKVVTSPYVNVSCYNKKGLLWIIESMKWMTACMTQGSPHIGITQAGRLCAFYCRLCEIPSESPPVCF